MTVTAYTAIFAAKLTRLESRIDRMQADAAVGDDALVGLLRAEAERLRRMLADLPADTDTDLAA